jgi:hypothetical protein
MHMAITVLLAPGTGDAESADVTLIDGAGATLSATGAGIVEIQPKMSSGYGPGESFGTSGIRTVQVFGPLTFRARRVGDSSAGVDMEKA